MTSFTQPQDRVAILRFSDDMSIEKVMKVYTDSIEYTAQHIVDLSDSPVSYRMIFGVLQQLMQGIAGAMIQPSMKVTVVGTPGMASWFATYNIPFFEKLEEALMSSRSTIAA